MIYRFSFFSIVSFLMISAYSFAQSGSKYDANEAFAPMFYPAYGDETRTASGTPGTRYWQNRADYKINATLDDVNHSISGSVIISYKNKFQRWNMSQLCLTFDAKPC